MKITLVQSVLAWGNVSENLANFGKKLSECEECDIIVLPEMFASGSMVVRKSHKIAEAEKFASASRFSEIRLWMLQWACRQDALVMGSTVCEESGNCYNRMIVAFPDGHCLYYDKRHCFRMGGENEYFSAGKKHLIFEFRGMKIATFVCYDLRFPVWSRNVQKYDLAVYIANWPESRREAWDILLKARAVENQVFVAGVNCVGTDANGIHYSGDSMVVDYRGKKIAEICEPKEETVTVELDLSALQDARRKFDVLEDRDDFTLKY